MTATQLPINELFMNYNANSVDEMA